MYYLHDNNDVQLSLSTEFECSPNLGHSSDFGGFGLKGHNNSAQGRMKRPKLRKVALDTCFHSALTLSLPVDLRRWSGDLRILEAGSKSNRFRQLAVIADEQQALAFATGNLVGWDRSCDNRHITRWRSPRAYSIPIFSKSNPLARGSRQRLEGWGHGLKSNATFPLPFDA